MARHQKGEQPVSDEAFEEFPERIEEYFDRVRAMLEEDLESSKED